MSFLRIFMHVYLKIYLYKYTVIHFTSSIIYPLSAGANSLSIQNHTQQARRPTQCTTLCTLWKDSEKGIPFAWMRHSFSRSFVFYLLILYSNAEHNRCWLYAIPVCWSAVVRNIHPDNTKNTLTRFQFVYNLVESIYFAITQIQRASFNGLLTL